MTAKLQNKLTKEHARIVRFLMTGVLNTLLGYLFIASFVFLGTGPFIANLLGFGLGLSVSYTLNKRLVFSDVAAKPFQGIKYICAFLIAYATNLLVLSALLGMLNVNEYLAQFIAIMSYALIMYILLRYFVFTDNNKTGDTR